MVIHMQQRVANFLGVVGTDIPIKELIRMTSPFKLGVNGYAFAITNNGHIIFHPDWRPVVRLILRLHPVAIHHYPKYFLSYTKACFISQSQLPDDILKPNYNAIDLMEIELMDNDTCFRNNDSSLHEVTCIHLTFSFSTEVVRKNRWQNCVL